MSLCRYLPAPSDRMAIIWSLLSVKDSLILEYGPAGTTHFSMSLYGTLGIDWQQRLFTTHMSEDDVVMGDVTRLEEAILELDQSYNPKVIFVVASSISAVIGTDIKGVCRYMQKEVKAKLVSFEQGGFRGDYSVGLTEVYKLLVNNLAAESTAKASGAYNIIGASMGRYRMASDIWEIRSLLREAFGYEAQACLCCETSVEEIASLGAAEVNIVLSSEGVAAAKILQEKFGTPYIYLAPYGYAATLNFLQQVGELIGKNPAAAVIERIKNKQANLAMYGMYAMMGGMRKHKAQAVVKGDYDLVCGVSAFMEQAGIKVAHKICSHALKTIEQPENGVVFYPEEKDCLAVLRSLQYTLVLADDISLLQCGGSNTLLRVSAPFINGSQIANHLPLMGEKGADFLLEYVDLYYQRLN